jgi:hypothetical protein
MECPTSTALLTVHTCASTLFQSIPSLRSRLSPSFTITHPQSTPAGHRRPTISTPEPCTHFAVHQPHPGIHRSSPAGHRWLQCPLPDTRSYSPFPTASLFPHLTTPTPLSVGHRPPQCPHPSAAFPPSCHTGHEHPQCPLPNPYLSTWTPLTFSLNATVHAPFLIKKLWPPTLTCPTH